MTGRESMIIPESHGAYSFSFQSSSTTSSSSYAAERPYHPVSADVPDLARCGSPKLSCFRQRDQHPRPGREVFSGRRGPWSSKKEWVHRARRQVPHQKGFILPSYVYFFVRHLKYQFWRFLRWITSQQEKNKLRLTPKKAHHGTTWRTRWRLHRRWEVGSVRPFPGRAARQPSKSFFALVS